MVEPKYYLLLLYHIFIFIVNSFQLNFVGKYTTWKLSSPLYAAAELGVLSRLRHHPLHADSPASAQASLVKSLTNVPLVVTFAPSHIDDPTGLAGVVPPDCVISVSHRIHKLVRFNHSFTSYTVSFFISCS